MGVRSPLSLSLSLPQSLSRCEGEVKELQHAQQEVSAELGERQVRCQELRETLEKMETELTQAEENRRQVCSQASAMKEVSPLHKPSN